MKETAQRGAVSDGSRLGARRKKVKVSGLPPCNLCSALIVRSETGKHSCRDKDLLARETLGENKSIYLEIEENHKLNSLRATARNVLIITMVNNMHKGVHSWCCASVSTLVLRSMRLKRLRKSRSSAEPTMVFGWASACTSRFGSALYGWIWYVKRGDPLLQK